MHRPSRTGCCDHQRIPARFPLHRLRTSAERLHQNRGMDCAGARGLRFPALPVKPEPETVFLMRNPLMAILPEDHPLQDLEAFPVETLCKEPFLLPEKGSKAEISGIFEHSRLMPPSPLGATMPFSRWWKAVWASACCRSWFCAASLIAPRFARFFLAYRDIVPALRSKKSVPLALKRFLDDLPFRFPAARLKGKPFLSPVRSSFP